MNCLRRQFYLIAISVPFFAIPAHQVIAVNLVAVGSGGTIRQSPDSGGNWYIRSSGTVNGLIAVDCVLENCWVVGDGGTILHSNDAGVTWAPQSSDTVQSLLDVDFVDSSTGWAVGGNGTILKTTDGGIVWSPQESSTPGVQFRSVFALSDSSVWIGGQNGTIRHTTNGGISWSFQTPAQEEEVLINEIYFTSYAKGVYGGAYNSSRAGITSDGGATWSPVETDSLSGGAITAIDFVNAQLGWVTGSSAFLGGSGLVGYTTDGGLTWERSMSVGTNAAINGIAMIDENRGWIVVGSGQIRTTQNGGESWTGQASGTTQTLLDVIAVKSPQYPDFDGDGDVDGRDFLIWQRGYGSAEGATLEQGDASSDGRVDSADLEIWQANYGAGPIAIATVPESNHFLLMPIGYLITIGARIKQFRSR